jgi:hypothetical protein
MNKIINFMRTENYDYLALGFGIGIAFTSFIIGLWIMFILGILIAGIHYALVRLQK